MNVARVSLFLLMALALVFAAYVPLGAVEHPPDINPDNFIPRQPINNPYFPLPVGRLFVYEGTKEGVPTHDEICVTGQTRVIEGVQATVVHHQSFEGNPRVLVEDTRDFHAQDIFHNVWYLGEDTIEIPSGSTEGSWESGVNDADAGFIMLANPHVGDQYYQEFAPKVAEDQAKVLSTDESLIVRGVTYNNVILTKETSRLDPGVVEYKYFAPGIGFILGVMIRGGDERTELAGIGTCSE